MDEKIKQIIAELLGKAPLARTGIQNSLLSRGFDTPAEREAFLGGILGAGSHLAGDELMAAGLDDGFLPGAVTGGVAGAGAGAGLTNFQEKMDFIKNNQTLSDFEKKQLLGIVPQEAQTAWQQKMQYIRDNPNATFDVGLGIDGQEEGYTFTGDGGLSEVGLAEFRRRYNIQPNLGGGSDSSNLGFTPNVDAISNLSSDFVGGFTGRGLDTPAQRHSIGEIMSALSPQEQDKVKMIISHMTPMQQEDFINGMMDGSIDPGGYGVQDEALPFGWQ